MPPLTGRLKPCPSQNQFFKPLSLLYSSSKLYPLRLRSFAPPDGRGGCPYLACLVIHAYQIQACTRRGRACSGTIPRVENTLKIFCLQRFAADQDERAYEIPHHVV